MLLPMAFGVCFSPFKFRNIRYEQSDLEIEQYQILFPTTPCNKRSFWNAKDLIDTRKTFNVVCHDPCKYTVSCSISALSQ